MFTTSYQVRLLLFYQCYPVISGKVIIVYQFYPIMSSKVIIVYQFYPIMPGNVIIKYFSSSVLKTSELSRVRCTYKYNIREISNS